MKKILFITCLFLFATLCLNAQTNIFPTSGNVGIGTTSPMGKLDIKVGGWGNIPSIIFSQTSDHPSIRLYRPTGLTNPYTVYPWWIENNNNLAFKTGVTNEIGSETVTEVVTFTREGKVGIGTTSPNFKAHIVSTVSAKALKVENINGGYANVDVSSNRSSGNIGGFRFFTNGDTYATTELNTIVNGDFYIGTGTGSNVPSTRLTVTSLGNVGIGTATPTQKLDINGSIQSNGLVLIDPILGTNSDFTKLYREDLGNDNAIVKLRIGDDVLGGFDIGYKYWSTGEWVSTFFVNNYGNVGIGTTTPDAKLTVKGNIHTNEVKVDLLGAVAPDYVFYKDYDLKSLKAVEDYITTNGHLPNIPSAKDMETEGIMLKEMNLKLLEKIEELTLYAIEQEKELQNQKLINKNLEGRLQKIEDLLSSKK